MYRGSSGGTSDDDFDDGETDDGEDDGHRLNIGNFDDGDGRGLGGDASETDALKAESEY